MQLIVISNEYELGAEQESVCSLLKEGLSSFHIRKPNYTLEQLRKYIYQIPEKYHPHLVIHSHFSLVNEFDIKGIHLPDSIRRTYLKEILRNHPNHKIISTSIHDLSEIMDLEFNFEYVFLSPVFNSISKSGYLSGFNWNALNNFLTTYKSNRAINAPEIIALGGITDENISIIKGSAFDGAALLGFIWQGNDSLKQFRKIVAKTEQ